MLKIEILDSGDLRLTIPESEDREELKEQYEHRNHLNMWGELFEPFYTNGRFHLVHPEQHDFGLTSDPYMVVEDVTLEDNGDLTCSGKFWHYPNYMVTCPIDYLIDGYDVVLTKWHQADEPETRYSHDNLIKMENKICDGHL